jgi:iron complex outermembrane receptor protein
MFALLKKEWLQANLSFGCRYDWRQLTIPNFVRYQVNYAYNRLFNGITSGITFNKKWEKNYLLSASLQSGWRPPSVNELYSYGLHYGVAGFEMGDSLLTPERSFLLDINVKKSTKNWLFEVGIFSQTFLNFIYRNPMSDPILTIRGAFPAFKYSQQNAQLLGMETSGSFRPENGWQFEMRLSYLYAQNTGLNQALLWMPANRMEQQLGYVFKDRTAVRKAYIELQSVWVAKQNRVVQGVDFKEVPIAYVLLNVQSGFSFKPSSKSKDWKVNLSIQNLLNQSYRDYLSRFRYFTNDPGINVIINLVIPF